MSADRRSRRVRLCTWAAASVLLLFAFGFSGLRNVKIGDTVPTFTLPNAEGQSVSLREAKGKVVVLLFWRTTQRRGAEALRALETIRKRFEGRDLVILALSGDAGGFDAIRKVQESVKVSFPLLYDEGEKVYGDYGIFVTPTTLLIDPEGKLFYYYPGFRSADYLQQIVGRIEVLLGDKTLAEFEASLKRETAPKVSESERKVKRYMNAGRRLLEKGMVRSAIRQFERAVAQDPKLFEAHLLLGNLYVREKKIDKAATAFRRALELKPNSAEAHAGLGDVLFFQEDLAGAKASVQLALRLNPNLARAHYRLGRILEEEGQIEAALAEYKTALRILLNIE